MPSPQQDQNNTALCASCGNPVVATAEHYNIRGDGPYHRLCIPASADREDYADDPPVVLSKRRRPMLRVVK